MNTHDEFGAVLPPGHSSRPSMPLRAQKNQRQILEYLSAIAFEGFRLGREAGTIERNHA
jgi:hypothetical protein